MKTRLHIALLLTAAAPALLHAQGGSLTPPPGAPAPVMKSLDQIEARTPLVAGSPGVTVNGVTGAITITAPGSYYLTGNLTTTSTASCINVGNHTCTIDLNGFIISRTTGTESGSAGIFINGAADQKVMIRNGHIRGGSTTAGFAAAIYVSSSTSGSVHVQDIHVMNVRNGIILNYQEARNSVRNSSVENSGGEGIRAEIVTDCVVRDTASSGIYGDIISNCSVRQTQSGAGRIGINGIGSGGRSIVSNCNSVTTEAIAIRASIVTNSYGRAGSNIAIDSTLATGSTAFRSNAGVALNAITAVGCVVPSGTATIDNKYNMP